MEPDLDGVASDTNDALRDHGWGSTAIALERMGETIVWAMARSGNPVLAHHSRSCEPTL
jgi:hypothetical protein